MRHHRPLMLRCETTSFNVAASSAGVSFGRVISVTLTTWPASILAMTRRASPTGTPSLAMGTMNACPSRPATDSDSVLVHRGDRSALRKTRRATSGNGLAAVAASAGHVGRQAFDAVGQALMLKEFQRAVDGGRLGRPLAALTEGGDQIVGLHRMAGLHQ